MSDTVDKIADIDKNVGALVGQALRWGKDNFDHVWAVAQHGTLPQRLIALLAVIALLLFFAFFLWAVVQAIIVSIRPTAYALIFGAISFFLLTVLTYL